MPATRTAANMAAPASASRFAMPVSGKVIRAYVKKKNDGIDIAAAAGSSVKAAADGTVAAVTKDTTGTPIVVIRHADGILVTGPVSRNMREAVLATWAAVPEPRIAIAVGSCAISGGLFADSDECCGGLPPLCDVQLFVPGCPPSPWSILDGLLRLKSEKDVL